jgi:hypothetical protein
MVERERRKDLLHDLLQSTSLGAGQGVGFSSATQLRPLTDEMVSLFARCLELQKQGHDRAGINTAKHWEFVALSKRLQWQLIGLPAHCVSVFDPEIDGPPPKFLTPAHAMFIDWPLVQSWRRALMAAVDEQRNRDH